MMAQPRVRKARLDPLPQAVVDLQGRRVFFVFVSAVSHSDNINEA